MFIAEESFWKLFPEAEIGVIVVKGLNNRHEIYDMHPEIRSDLEEANKEAVKWLTATPISQCSVISVWRKAFQKFKKKKGNRSSIEAMLSRVDKGSKVDQINPLVDIYNAVSLRYAFPAGGENSDAFAGDMRLAVSENGGDDFFALGDEESNPTLPGELCYLDDKGAICRCWNWREGQRTMLTEETTNAFLIIESVDPERHDDLITALNELEEKTISQVGGKVTAKTVINTDNREVEI